MRILRLAADCWLLALAGCGYALVGHSNFLDPKVRSIQVPAFVNRTTRVELEHRGFEALGARANEVREAIGGEGGWNSLLERFAAAARAA